MSALIAGYCRHMRAGGYAPHTTIEDRRKLLIRLDRELPMGLDRCTTEELEDFLARFDCRSTQRSYYAGIVGYFRWACDPRDPQLDYDPAAGLRRPKPVRHVPKPVTDDQLRHALTHLPDPWRTYVTLAAYAGARCGEIATIHREEITERRIRITGKGGKTRVLMTHPQVWQSVRHFPAGRIARRINDDQAPTPDYVSSRTILKLQQIGLNGITLHMFRHWYGTTMLRPREFGGGGASLRCVQENLGHESVTSTAIYTLVSDEERDAGIAALPTFTSDPC